jgi:hypothetical protein
MHDEIKFFTNRFKDKIKKETYPKDDKEYWNES